MSFWRAFLNIIKTNCLETHSSTINCRKKSNFNPKVVQFIIFISNIITTICGDNKYINNQNKKREENLLKHMFRAYLYDLTIYTYIFMMTFIFNYWKSSLALEMVCEFDTFYVWYNYANWLQTFFDVCDFLNCIWPQHIF